MNPWLSISADDYSSHMEHESVAQGALLREHFEVCVRRTQPRNLLFLGAGIGNGMECEAVSRLQDIHAVDVNPRYLELLKGRFPHLPLRTSCCEFPNEFSDDERFDLVYAALFFEYVDVHAALACIAEYLSPSGCLIALLQQASTAGKVTNTGVTSLSKLREIMTVYSHDEFESVAQQLGYRVVDRRELSRCAKPFLEVTLEK